MATFDTPTANARMTATRDQIDAALTPGELVIGTAGMAADLVRFPLQDPCGAVAAGRLTLSGAPFEANAEAAGTAAAAEIRDGDGTTRVNLDWGTEITLDNPSLVLGQIVRIAEITIDDQPA